MTTFRSVRDFCLARFGSRNLSAEHIVHIWVEDAASVWKHGSESARGVYTHLLRDEQAGRPDPLGLGAPAGGRR